MPALSSTPSLRGARSSRLPATAPGQLPRYAVVSAVALAADTSTFLAGLHLGLGWALAAALGFSLGLVVSYVGSTGFVFSARRLQDRRLEFIAYGAIGVCGLLLTQLSLWVWLTQLHLPPLPGKLATAVAVFGFNFSTRRTLLFAPREA